VEEEGGRDVWVGAGSGNFWPGFNASRQIQDDKTIFLQSDGTDQIQTIDIEVTPQIVEPNMFDIHIEVPDSPLVDAMITSASSSAGTVDYDGQHAHINVEDPGFDNTFTATVVMSVTPNIPEVEFIPYVEIVRTPFTPLYPTTSTPIDLETEIGTWTWDALGTYRWQVHTEEVISRGLTWQPSVRDLYNHVYVNFENILQYRTGEDTFTNDEVTGEKRWASHVYNTADGTGEPISALALRFDSELGFDGAWPEENLIQLGPPTYKWFYGDVPENGFHPECDADVRIRPANFTPGFDASRSVDKDHFTGPDDQVLTITLTPQDITEDLAIWVEVQENELVDAVITPPTGDGDFDYVLSPDRYWLDVRPYNLELDDTLTINVIIEVTPMVPEVVYVPLVHVLQDKVLEFNTDVGSSITSPAHDPADLEDEIGVWTYNADGSYVWHWDELLVKRVTFEGYQNEVSVSFGSNAEYSVSGETFKNHEVTGSRRWWTSIANLPDGTGAPVNGLALTLDSLLEFDRVLMEDLVTMGPPTYEWLIGEFPEWGKTNRSVRFFSPDPSPIMFTPGFDASRTLDKTEFLQSEGTQKQKVNIAVTSHCEEETMFVVGVFAEDEFNAPDEYDLVNAVIPAAGGGNIFFTSLPLEPGGTWATTVEILVTPNVPRVKFEPYVYVGTREEIDAGVAGGNSVSYPALEPGNLMDDVGTWTWNSDGIYAWYWNARFGKGVEWQSHCGDGIDDYVIDHMFIDFERRPKLDEIVGKATFQLGEGATYDLDVDDVTVSIDGVDITIPAGSFVKRGNSGERYIFESTQGSKPKVLMDLDFDVGEWSLKVRDIDASTVNGYDGVDIAFCVGYMAAKANIDMKVGGLSYIAED
jgi:hypothetical protein